MKQLHITLSGSIVGLVRNRSRNVGRRFASKGSDPFSATKCLCGVGPEQPPRNQSDSNC